MRTLHWKVHTPNILQEIMNNNETQALRIPLNILAVLLLSVAQRAAELNDKKLNSLMMKMTLYSIADPESKDYRPNKVSKLIAEAEK